MPEPTTAENMVTALEAFLATNVGIGQVTVDGQTVQYNRQQAMEELKYWKTILAKESGTKKPVRSINLGNMW